ncbi:HNH endonuclease signature motif containing protein [Parafrigoribacterium soli]|uniref:HNH endonuclease signature motif containing protein n=1 Tax=Parafrigoribacterium soli TaxID=3144663 RepID=UPI0032EF814F
MEKVVDTATSEATPSLHAAVAETISDIVDAVVGVEKMIAGLTAMRAELLNQAIVFAELEDQVSSTDSSPFIPSQSMQWRSLRAEVACAMRIPERTAENQIATAHGLTRSLPLTLVALKVGEISYRHAEAIVDSVAGLDADATAALEAAALPYARNLTVAKFERKLRTLRERTNPETIVERRERATTDREVTFTPGRDGMAWLSAYLPAPDALAAFHRLTELAGCLRAIDKTSSDSVPTRALAQARADALRDLLVDGEPALEGPRGIRPTVYVTVPAMTLLGRSDEPANLDGYGPIDAETARELAARAPSFIRLLTHPETGTVLSVGKDSYRVPSDLKNWLRLRDSTCRFPGCSRTAYQCDIDHTDDWAYGGETRHDNLAHLCRSHHRLKHNSGWRVQHNHSVNEPPGTLTWISPSGHEYTTEPDVRLRA